MKTMAAAGAMDSSRLDRAYFAHQVDGHAQAVASLRADAVHGSDPALRADARRTLPVVLGHQRMLEQLTGQPKPMG